MFQISYMATRSGGDQFHKMAGGHCSVQGQSCDLFLYFGNKRKEMESFLLSSEKMSSRGTLFLF